MLVACTGCARHVRAGEAACPFCGAALADASAKERAVLRSVVALGAMTIASGAMTIACGKTPATNDAPADAASAAPTEVHHEQRPAPVYGAPPMRPRAPADAGSLGDLFKALDGGASSGSGGSSEGAK